MSENPLDSVRKERQIPVTAADLPLCCPLPDEPVALLHPRVYLDPVTSGKAVCPYCSREFLFTGEPPKGHH
ncbi:zinc-finger domain-containing protein [Hydrogenophilus thiooxidans]|uniref:zinc-finger domain-containing protein n=1 Tax=Hydrogenophilus TaxID=70774 RepID=UPI001C226761|nr:zinc-finger domain-containing protein [Hydrogenophilus thiooxidans]